MALTCKEVNVSSFRSMVRARWPKLNADDLDIIDSDPEMLVELVQEKYKLDADEADKQVYDFEVSNKLPDLASMKAPSASYA